MSSFNHAALIQDISQSMAGLRKAQPEAMQGFGQLAKAAMTAGSISEKHKELIAGHWHHAALFGLHWFSYQGAAPPELQPGRAGRHAGRVRLHGWRPGPDVRRRSAPGLASTGASGHGLSGCRRQRCAALLRSAWSTGSARPVSGPATTTLAACLQMRPCSSTSRAAATPRGLGRVVVDGHERHVLVGGQGHQGSNFCKFHHGFLQS